MQLHLNRERNIGCVLAEWGLALAIVSMVPSIFTDKFGDGSRHWPGDIANSISTGLMISALFLAIAGFFLQPRKPLRMFAVTIVVLIYSYTLIPYYAY